MIKTKAELIAAMQADPDARLYGHTGARPSSPWKYTLQRADHSEIDTVSSVAVNACNAAKALHVLRNHWTHSRYRLAAALRVAA